MSAVEKRLEEVYRRAKVIPFDKQSKFIIMSDCHRGQGNASDNFLPNQNVYFGALKHYFQNGFTYIELGDGDELWENRNIEPIQESHSDVFWLLSRFYREHRFYMLYGNHDIVKSRDSFVQKHYRRYYCEASCCHVPLFPGIEMPEGLVLENSATRQRLFLTHGHQGDLLNDTLWPLARFLVRYLWGPLELVGFIAPTGAGRNRRKKDKIERRLAGYAQASQRILICGHTHRPVFPEPGVGCYFNDGSCVHPRCITGLEIVGNRIALVKWSVSTRPDQLLYVGRQVLEGPIPLEDFCTGGESDAREQPCRGCPLADLDVRLMGTNGSPAHPD